MPEEKNDKKKTKGPLATIWEFMNKTGGCCGPGESCCGSEEKDSGKENKKIEKKDKKQ